MHFTNMQGCGNDYIYVDCFREPMPHDPVGLSRAISDRHFGVGSDGLILICPSDKADVDMGEPILDAERIPTTLAGNPPVSVPLILPDLLERVALPGYPFLKTHKFQ